MTDYSPEEIAQMPTRDQLIKLLGNLPDGAIQVTDDDGSVVVLGTNSPLRLAGRDTYEAETGKKGGPIQCAVTGMSDVTLTKVGKDQYIVHGNPTMARARMMYNNLRRNLLSRLPKRQASRGRMFVFGRAADGSVSRDEVLTRKEKDRRKAARKMSEASKRANR